MLLKSTQGREGKGDTRRGSDKTFPLVVAACFPALARLNGCASPNFRYARSDHASSVSGRFMCSRRSRRGETDTLRKTAELPQAAAAPVNPESENGNYFASDDYRNRLP